MRARLYRAMFMTAAVLVAARFFVQLRRMK
jgi:hypothetical protein